MRHALPIAVLFLLAVLPHHALAAEDVTALLTRAESLATKGTPEERRATRDALVPMLEGVHNAGDAVIEGRLLAALGRLCDQTGDTQHASEYLMRALPLVRESQDDPRLLNVLQGLGLVNSTLNEPQKAIEYYTEALELSRNLGNRFQEGIILNNLGTRYWVLSEFDRALEMFQAALDIRRSLSDSVGVAYTLEGLTALYYEIGEFQHGLDCANEALPIWRETKAKAREANTLANIGLLNYSLNEPRKALRFYQQALPLVHSAQDRAVEVRITNNMGLALFALGHYQEALAQFSTVLKIPSPAQEPRSQAYALHNTGDVYLKLGMPAKALSFYQRSLDLKRDLHDRYGEAFTLNNLGECLTALHRRSDAIVALKDALDLRRSIHDRAGQAVSLAAIARVLRDDGQLDAAREDIESALVLVDTARLELANTDLRASYFSSVSKWYEFYIDVLMRQNRIHPDPQLPATALEASERSRSRRLLDSLGDFQSRLRLDASKELLAEERKAARGLRSEISRIQAGQSSSPSRLGELLDAHSDIEARIRTSSPRYASLVQPQPALAPEIQALLDASTVILEYSLGERRSFLFGVTNHRVFAYELPSRGEIERLVHEAWEALNERAKPVPSESPEQRKLRLDAARQRWKSASSSLSDILLRPALPILGRKRIVIVADGAIQLLPFSALSDPEGAEYLIGRHEIVAVPSASAIAALRAGASERTTSKGQIAILADPVLSPFDPRLPVHPAQSPGGVSYRRLRYSGEEAKRLLSLAPSHSVFLATGFAASRKLLDSGRLADFQTVHFATHVVVSAGRPELSGLVLSLFDEQGRPQDGFVNLTDIYNLKLGADLVVLGACEAATGPDLPGEGLQSLTRAFQYAGVPRVLAALWEVDDRGTADWMVAFYRAMWQRHMSPASAVREAQLALKQRPEYADPWFWASFTLSGEWQ